MPVAQQETVKIKTEIKLPEDVLAKISVGGDPVKTVTSMAEYLLTTFANGAMIVKPETLERIDKLIGMKIGEEDLVQMAAEAYNANESGWVRARLDPVNLPALEDLARMAGNTVQEFVQSYFDEAMEKGWMWQHDPRGQEQVTLTLEQKRDIEKRLGVESLMGDDVYKFICKNAEKPLEFTEA